MQNQLPAVKGTVAPYGIDICLAVPPFHAIDFPPLGPGVLTSGCQARGLTVRNIGGSSILAARIGFDLYDTLCKTPKHSMLGERLYRPYAYPPEVMATLPAVIPLPEDHQTLYDLVAPAIEPALDIFVEQVLALRPRILGISSNFEQNLASAAFARRVRAADPDICIVMGGANTSWPMSRGLAEIFPWVDHFFAGEADVDFPAFCEQLIRHGERPAERIIRSEPIKDMRAVFAPDFTDYLEELKSYQLKGELPDWLPRFLTLESSRGCWWGAKHHCTFCGLNADGMDFRDKPADRMREELKSMAHLGVDHIWMTDNIMPIQYLKDLLPELAKTEPRMKLFYEVKANLTADQIDIMGRGGVDTIQPGIESLSSNILRIMRKGVSGHQNIALLRHCAGIGMFVIWNILYGFPGETAEDFEEMITLMPMIEHLQPATGAHEIIIDRYSPYFNEPEKLGIGPIAPFQVYRTLYPADARIEDIAYHFAGNQSTPILDDPDLLARLKSAVSAWAESWKATPRPSLQMFDTPTSTLILDTRAIARQHFTPISAEQKDALIRLEKPLTRAGMDPALEVHAEWLLSHDFVIEHEGKIMSVVVRARPEVTAMMKASHLTSTRGSSTRESDTAVETNWASG